MKIKVETKNNNQVSITHLDTELGHTFELYRNDFEDRKILAKELIKGAFEVLATCPDTMSVLDDLYDTITELEDDIDNG